MIESKIRRKENTRFYIGSTQYWCPLFLVYIDGIQCSDLAIAMHYYKASSNEILSLYVDIVLLSWAGLQDNNFLIGPLMGTN